MIEESRIEVRMVCECGCVTRALSLPSVQTEDKRSFAAFIQDDTCIYIFAQSAAK